MNLLTTIKHAIIPEPPSIRQQTPFQCDFYDFGRAKTSSVDYFNCGIVQRDDGLWLVTRRARNWEHKDGYNDVVAFSLRDKQPIKGFAMRFLKSFADQHYEDPRAIFHKGQTYVSTTTFLILGLKRWTRAHQVLSVCDNDWRTVRQLTVQYGNNRGTVLDNTGMEKNWLWFFHDDKLHMVYNTVPHEVVPLDEELKPAKSYLTKTFDPGWVEKYGHPRGGTPPVRVNGEYWSFFHSSIPWINKKRRYMMGAYAFNAYPPFEVTRVTPKPILIGSRHDPWNEKKPACVFPCGAILNDGMWTVTGGCNDILSFWMDIPHSALVKLTSVVIPNENTIDAAVRETEA